MEPRRPILLDEVRRRDLAASSRARYAIDQDDFRAWLLRAAVTLDEVTDVALAEYALDLYARGYAAETIAGRTGAAVALLEDEGHPVPSRAVLRRALRRIRRILGGKRKARPLTVDDVRQIATSMRRALGRLQDEGERLRIYRDLAMLLVGWAAGLRAGELAGLRVENVTFAPEGAILFLPRSKTDQLGEGSAIGLPTDGAPRVLCPTRALREWIGEAQVGKDGPLFRRIWAGGRLGDEALTRHGVRVVVLARARGAGLDLDRVMPHSLRRGIITTAYRYRVAEADLQAHVRHAMAQTTRDYREEGEVLAPSNALGQLWAAVNRDERRRARRGPRRSDAK